MLTSILYSVWRLVISDYTWLLCEGGCLFSSMFDEVRGSKIVSTLAPAEKTLIENVEVTDIY